MSWLNLLETVPCAACSAEVEVAGWHDCPAAQADPVSVARKIELYLLSNEGRFFAYLAERSRSGEIAVSSPSRSSTLEW